MEENGKQLNIRMSIWPLLFFALVWALLLVVGKTWPYSELFNQIRAFSFYATSVLLLSFIFNEIQRFRQVEEGKSTVNKNAKTGQNEKAKKSKLSMFAIKSKEANKKSIKNIGKAVTTNDDTLIGPEDIIAKEDIVGLDGKDRKDVKGSFPFTEEEEDLLKAKAGGEDQEDKSDKKTDQARNFDLEETGKKVGGFFLKLKGNRKKPPAKETTVDDIDLAEIDYEREISPSKINPCTNMDEDLNLIISKPKVKEGEIKEDTSKIKREINLWMGVLYLLINVVFASQYIKSAFLTLNTFDVAKSPPYTYIHVFVLLLIGILAFTIRKLLLVRSHGHDKTAMSFCSALGILGLLSAVSLVVTLILAVDTMLVLIWIMRIVAIYIVINIMINLIAALLKRQILTDYNYIIFIPYFSSAGRDSESLVKMLEANTGLSFKSLWSIGYLSSILPAAIIAIGLIFLVATSFYKVEPYQEAAVYRLGSLDKASIKESGFYVKMPWPIDKVEIYDVDRIKTLQIGYESSGSPNYFWTEIHDGGEYTLLLGNGNELVSVNIKLVFAIDDLYSYLTKHASPEDLLSSRAYEILMERTVVNNLNTFLSVNRSSLSEEINQELKEYSEKWGLGIKMDSVIIESIHPPITVADVYQRAVGAGIQKQILVTNAQGYASKLLVEAEQESATSIIKARENQITRKAEATYELAVYQGTYDAYRMSPQSFKLDKYLKTYESVVGGKKVYVFSPRVSPNLSNYIINGDLVKAKILD
ncbi:MAG: SPFH domain-containing protein [Anaerovoracaceae bacterium]|nr:SPFH domain-containing protein [Anaerovoracaceae bacterium]